jgi:hypothetical protein
MTVPAPSTSQSRFRAALTDGTTTYERRSRPSRSRAPWLVSTGAASSILRLGLLYGPGAARSIGRGLVHVGSWRYVLGAGDHHLPYTYVDNAVDCMLLAAARSKRGIEVHKVVDGRTGDSARCGRERRATAG